MLNTLVQETRYGARTLRKSPGFTTVAVLTIALGIGGATAIFTLIDSVLLRGLPYREAERLVTLREIVPAISHLYPSFGGNIRHVLMWRERAQSFESIAVAQGAKYTLGGSGEPEQLIAARVSANIFTTLGVEPVFGRRFRDAEDAPGQDKVTILTHDLWQRRFQADPAIVGKAISLDGVPHEVVGVLPPTFRFPKNDELGPLTFLGERTDLFVPLGIELEPVSLVGSFDFGVIARLKPNVTLSQVQAEFEVVQGSLGQAYPRLKGLRGRVEPLQSVIVRHVRRGLWLLMAAVFTVLLIANVNLANLLLARGETRQREWAIRTALGAGRITLVRQVLIECVLLSLAGGLLGALLAGAAVRVLIARAPIDLPRLVEVGLNGRLIAFALVASAVTAILFGMLPAWRLTRMDPQATLVSTTQRAGTGGRSRHLRDLLVGAEVTLSVALLILISTLWMSIGRLMEVDKGFATTNVVALDLSLPPASYRPPERRQAFVDRVLEATRNVSGVSSSAMISHLPLRGDAWVDEIRLDGEAPQPGQKGRGLANFRFTSAAYFRTLDIPLRSGRLFDDGDRKRQVALISERAAKAMWPNQDPIGRRFSRGGQGIFYDVIGVVADIRTVSLELAPAPMVYLPYWGEGNGGPGPGMQMSILVRTAVDPSALVGTIRSEVQRVDPALPIGRIQTFDEIVAETLGGRRFQSILLSVFGASALLLAGLGIYGVCAYAVARRSTEIGLRLALGATASQIRSLVLAQTAKPVIAGALVGIAGGIAAAGLFKSLIFGVTSTHPMVIGTTLLLVLLVTAVSTYVPVRRAMAVPPGSALRQDDSGV